MIFRSATKLWRTPANACGRRSQVGPTPGCRWRSVHGGAMDRSSVNPVALQMIDYALSLAKSHNSEESCAQGMLVLEQCLTSQSSGDASCDDVATQNSKGMVLLAMSNLLYSRGNHNDAMDKLRSIGELADSSLGVRVAAMEGLVGLNLELEDDESASMVADNCLRLLEKDEKVSGDGSVEFVDARAKAIKGLVELVRGNVPSAKSCIQGLKDNEGSAKSVALSYGEILHSTQEFIHAKDLYQKVIVALGKTKDFTDVKALGACNMSLDEVLLAAICSLGQLEGHMGNFSVAEEMLTKALNKAEQLFGSRHPKVGVVLTCLALMFRHKAIQEHSSSLLIQEGLYRRAIELLKVPLLDSEVKGTMRSMMDIAALARGGYAEALGVQQNRKSEGEKMKHWAEAAWKNSRLSLAEALKLSETSSKLLVIDTRICRVL